MEYQVNAYSVSNKDAIIQVKQSNIVFGTTASTADTLPNPAELYLGSFAACMLKNVERFSQMMKFSFTKATVEVNAARLKKPPIIDHVNYTLTIFSKEEKINIALLKKNIEKFGTIYNTVNLSCTITGTIKTVKDV